MSVLTLAVLSANAQINLQHTFDGTVSANGGIQMEQDAYPANTYVSAAVSGNSYVVKIYNGDYSLNTNNTYSFTPPTGYKVTGVSMSRKMFNSDDDYEFLVNYEKTDYVSDNTRAKAILYNKSGGVIKDFGTAYSVYVYTYLHVINNTLRLMVTKFDSNSNTTKTEIYSVPGTPAASAPSLKAKEVQNAYPNPANAEINLPYQLAQGEATMNIYNANGQLIESKVINSTSDRITLNVSGYVPGMYFYEVNGISNKFIVY